jgi:hypothetical protein
MRKGLASDLTGPEGFVLRMLDEAQRDARKGNGERAGAYLFLSSPLCEELTELLLGALGYEPESADTWLAELLADLPMPSDTDLMRELQADGFKVSIEERSMDAQKQRFNVRYLGEDPLYLFHKRRLPDETFTLWEAQIEQAQADGVELEVIGPVEEPVPSSLAVTFKGMSRSRRRGAAG